jgi:3-methyladenine DNA glycosylase/8-oxoguanine DNA glycosylase
MSKSSPDLQPDETSPSTSSAPTNTTSNNEEEDDYIQCSLETVYTSTEMAISPPHRPSTSQQTDNEHTRAIINEFLLLKTQYGQTKQIQHDLILNYHETIVKVITSLQQSNKAHQEQIEQLRADINNHIQDNETLKVFYRICFIQSFSIEII